VVRGIVRGALSWGLRIALSALIMWLLTRSILCTVVIPCIGVISVLVLQHWFRRLKRRGAGTGT
jgi:hypothetical protein